MEVANIKNYVTTLHLWNPSSNYVPTHHQQNGSVERKHHHIVETSLTLLAHCSAPLTYWVEAFQTVCYLINRLPSPILNNESPFKNFFLSDLITAFCVSLDVLVGVIFAFTTNTNSISTPTHASSLGIVPLTVATNAFIHQLVGSTSPDTSSLMIQFNHSPPICPSLKLPP
jgi:hypothetical protein